MINLTFYWDTWAIFNDGEVFRMLKREDYEGETWEKCCDNCALNSNFDDSDLVKGYEDKVLETNRKLKEITIQENGIEVNAVDEVYTYFMNYLVQLEKNN